MSTALAAIAAIFRRDAKQFWSYRMRALNQVIVAILTVVLFYELARLVTDARFRTPAEYFAFAVVGLASVPLLRSGLVAPGIELREEMIAGTFARIALAPVGVGLCCLASLAFPFVQAVGIGIVVLAFAALAFGLHVDLATCALALPIAALCAASFVPVAALILAIQILAKQASAAAQWFLSGLSLLSGVYFPIALLPGWLRVVAKLQPVTPSLDLLRHSLLGTKLTESAGASVGTLVAYAVIGMPIGALAISAACGFARRHGTLLEY